MALTPLILIAADRWLRDEPVSMDGVEAAEGLKGRVLIIGFGRFGQIASQMLLAQGIEVSLIDNDPDRIREAERFGAKVYFGDGARLDVLRQSGAETTDMVMVCVDAPSVTDRIVELVSKHFPSCRLLARSYDRGHSIKLRKTGVDYEIRETFESALVFGGAGLKALGMTALDVSEVTDDVRRRDSERLDAQAKAGMLAAGGKLNIAPKPEPLIPPRNRRAVVQTSGDRK
jgi:glutathione-regulated potassium-efflux system protein KefB